MLNSIFRLGETRPNWNGRMERNFLFIQIFRNFRPTSRGTPKISVGNSGKCLFHSLLEIPEFLVEWKASDVLSPLWIRCYSEISLQNRRNFLRILDRSQKNRSQSQATAKREPRARGGARLAFHARLAFAYVRLKYAKYYACSAGNSEIYLFL